MKRIFNSSLLVIVVFLVSLMVLAVSIRGLGGNPTAEELNDKKWKENGPFELSPERGRFTLTYSLVEDNSFHFSVPLARFSLPDLAYTNGHYASRFAPGVSYLAIGGYVAGRLLGISQVGAYSVIALVALANAILIYLISLELGAKKPAAVLGFLVFIFATPAFAYAVNLYQHHVSVLLILLSIYLLMKGKGVKSLITIWFLCAASIPVDYPNLLLMFPIGIFALAKVIKIEEMAKKFVVSVSLIKLLTMISAIIPVLFFLWFNLKSFDNPFQLSGTVGGVKAIDSKGNPMAPEFADEAQREQYLNPDAQDKSALAFFDSRKIINGLTIHLISLDRGVAVFTPIILLGIIGFYVLYKNANKYVALLISIVLIDLILYSMWGDPWGGWAFGSRYLIPAYSVMSIFISIALTEFSRKKVFLLVFSLAMFYSLVVNTLGAITTSANPPQVEIASLSEVSGKQELYSFDRNWEYLNTAGSKSYFYKEIASKYLDSRMFYFVLVGILSATAASTLIVLYSDKKQN